MCGISITFTRSENTLKIWWILMLRACKGVLFFLSWINFFIQISLLTQENYTRIEQWKSTYTTKSYSLAQGERGVERRRNPPVKQGRCGHMVIGPFHELRYYVKWLIPRIRQLPVFISEDFYLLTMLLLILKV